MATSLSEQLQKLSVPQTAIYRRDKKRPSLLFDPKEAARIDRETFYSIGMDGLEELIQRDPAFEQFKNTLFHTTSKDFQRAMQSTESNEKLDKNIRKFLFLLSPHFLFNCSYKALEWLIHRFSIYDFNKEDLLMLILPYHETNVFVRVLQLLQLRAARDKWTWLKHIQKSGVHLPKQALYNHAASDPHFLEFTSNFVLAIVKEIENPRTLTVVFNYYCTTYVGAIEYTEEVSELQVTHMLPVLLKGLTSDIPDFVAASYVIVAKLLTKTSLASTILEKFVDKIAQMSVPSLKTEASLILVIVYKSQPQFNAMSDVAFSSLRDKEGCTKLMQALNGDDVDAYPFLKVLFLCGIRKILNCEDGEADKKFLNDLFNDLKISDEFVDVLLISILELYGKNSKLSQTTTEWLKDFVRRIERQYPSAFDSSVKKIMNLTNSDLKHLKKILRKLINNLATVEKGYDLFEKLYHTNSVIKIEGVKILLEHFDDFYQKDLGMLQNSLTDCLQDEHCDIVVQTLVLFKSKLNEIFDETTLTDMLTKLLTTYPSSKKAWNVANVTLDVACSIFSDTNVKLLIYVLPFLLPTCKSELKTAKQIVGSTYGNRSKLIRAQQQELAELETPNEFCELILSSLKNGPPITTIIEVLKSIPQQNLTTLQKQVAILLLSNGLPQNNEAGIGLLVLDIFENYLYTSRVSIVKGESSTYNYIAMAKKDKFTLQGFLCGVEMLIKKTKKENRAIDLLDFSCDDDTSLFCIRILKLLVEGCSTQKSRSAAFFETLNVFFKHFCGGELNVIVKLLLNIAIAENELIDNDLRLSCLKLVKNLMHNENSRLKQFVKFEDVTVPYILVILTMANRELREIAVDLLRTLCSKSNSDAGCYVKLLVSVLTYEEEILLDHDQIPMMVFNTLSPEAIAGDALLKRAVDSLVVAIENSAYPIYLKAGIVTLLSYINSMEVYETTSKLGLKILRELAGVSRTASASESIVIYRNLLRFDSHVASRLKLNTPIWRFITESISNDSCVIQFQSTTTYPAVFLLKQIDRELFAQLTSSVQKAFLDLIVELAANTQNVNAVHAAAQVFKKIDLDVSLVSGQLQKMCDVQSTKADASKKKTASVPVPTLDILEAGEWKNGIAVLEFIQDKKKVKNTAVLLGVLFDILKKCLDFDEQSNLEYPKQLVLSTILHCCNKMEPGERLPETSFNMHLVVQCIRVSSNPQTHHHALVLLSHTAKLIPQEIMHNIIPIFTFVGSSVLRHDDVYSFQIMSKIIDTVIPILIKDGSEESIAGVLRVFVDAVLDVPEHRRMPVFLQLLTRLNPKDNLYLFLLIMFEAHVSHAQEDRQQVSREKGEADYVPKRLNVASDLLREFPVETIIATCIKTLQYLRTLPEQKEDNYTKNLHVYDMRYCTLKQFRHYKYTIVTFFSSFLASQKFVLKVAQVPDPELLQMECLFKELIVNTLSFIQDTSKVAQRNTNMPQAQYWKVMLHHSFDILDAINSLLHSKMFLVVVHGLMVYSLTSVRKRAIDLLNNKLQHNIDFFKDCDRDELCNILVAPLINIIKSVDEDQLDPDQELIIQKALFALKLLSKLLAPEFPDKFTEILKYLTDLMSNRLDKLNENIVASLILCVAELCYTLRAHCIPHLNKLMPVLLKIIKVNRSVDAPSLLLISNVAAINKILDRLVLFLSPYIEKLVYDMTLLAWQWQELDEQKFAHFLSKIQSIQQKLAAISLNVLLPAIESSYTKLIKLENYAAVTPLMTILTKTLSNLQSGDIQSNLPELTEFFLAALEFRGNGHGTLADANQVEDQVVKALLTLILKLSESTFRPLYCQIYDWAIHEESKRERVITFYNLSNAFVNSLKGLFTPYAGQFLNNAADLLESCNLLKKTQLYFEEEDNNIALVENILKTLQTVFIYDSQRFINKERFDVLMQPLVDQLENLLGGMDKLKVRAKTILIPCIVQFAVATADDSFWKQLNYQILLKTRHDVPESRLIALNCLGEVAKKLGEDFMPLLPETMPFLGELLEDEDDDVQNACRKTTQELEKVLGTSLQEYM